MDKSSIINTKNSFFAKYALINLLGQGFVVISGIICMPILISTMGAELFGVLILAWAVTGYFSIFVTESVPPPQRSPGETPRAPKAIAKVAQANQKVANKLKGPFRS